MTTLAETHARFVARLPTITDLYHADDTPGEITTAVDLNYGGNLWFTLYENGRLEVDIENIVGIDNFEGVGTVDDPVLFAHLHAAMTVLASLPPNDEWDLTGEHGYADATFMGTETWEDQKQLESIKRMKKIPDHWYLTKIRNFDGRKLQDMQTWLETNCQQRFQRVGWSSGCSTTVGIAFESTNDAFFYRMRWR